MCKSTHHQLEPVHQGTIAARCLRDFTLPLRREAAALHVRQRIARLSIRPLCGSQVRFVPQSGHCRRAKGIGRFYLGEQQPVTGFAPLHFVN